MWLHLFFNILLPLAVLVFLNRAIYTKLHQVKLNKQRNKDDQKFYTSQFSFLKGFQQFPMDQPIISIQTM